jgi:hypothetical protein
MAAEQLGLSRFSELYDDFNMATAAIGIWMLVVYFLINRMLRYSILRIYYKKSTDRFLYVGSNYRFKFYKEEFSANDIQKGTMRLKNQVLGNCIVNGKARFIDFSQFKSDDALKKLLRDKELPVD